MRMLLLIACALVTTVIACVVVQVGEPTLGGDKKLVEVDSGAPTAASAPAPAGSTPR
jgi:hypothetical protein